MSVFLSRARALLDANDILTGEDVSSRSCDPLKIVETRAQAILRPRNTSQIVAIMRLASECGQTIVLHGGRTGVSGGAYAESSDVVISLERMNAIEDIDTVNHTIVAQAGVTLQQLQDAAAEHGMYYPVDLGARGTATVGGMIATNAGGNRTLRWGMTRDRVLGLEVILPDGELVSSMHRLVKNNTGYDLRQMFIGAEGTLGIVTRAVFRLIPAPSSHDVALLALSDYDSVLTALSEAQKLSSLSAFELMYDNFYTAVARQSSISMPLPTGHPYYVLVESMGYHPEQDREVFEAYLNSLFTKARVIDIILAQSEAQCQFLWSIRESVEASVKEISPCLTYDVSLEVADIDDYVSGLRSKLEDYPESKMIVNGHIGDNNIHIGLSIGKDTQDRATEVNDIIYRPLAMYHGSMSAEHGIGTVKNEYLGISRSDEEVLLMRKIKSAIDPMNLLNPKVIFTSERGIQE